MIATLPRVSTILRLLYPDSLHFVQEDDLERGTRLHGYMETWAKAYIHGDEPPDMTDFSEGERVRLEALVDWIVKANVEPLQAEEFFQSKYGYCGHPDLVALWKGKQWVIDWKFAESITEQNRMQGEAYRPLVPGCQGVALVQVPKSTKIVTHKLKPRPDLWALYLNGLAVWRKQHDH